MSPNHYLDGNFAPVATEETVTDLQVTGALPEHLDGRYLRNGPNPIGAVDPDNYHWFLGAGMVHGIRLRGGKAEWYRNRWVRSGEVADQLGEPRRPGPVHAGFDFSANTSVMDVAGRTFAIVEGGGNPFELSHTLDSIGPCEFEGTLPGGYTAHPKRDPDTGEIHAVSYFFGWGNKVKYSVIGTDARVRRVVDIEVGGSPMMHDFSLTEKHVVVYDLPVTFDISLVAAAAPGPLRGPIKAVGSRVIGRATLPDRMVEAMTSMPSARTTPVLPYSWNPDYPARVGVMRRDSDGSEVRWFEVDPCYVFHPLNAYDDGDTVVLDVARHPKMFATDLHGPNEGMPTLDRWTVDLKAGKVLESRCDDRGQEFPRIDERLTGKRHRYGYTVGFEQGASGAIEFADALIRHDLVSGTSTVRSFGAGKTVGEFVFVPEAPDAAEDQGVLMGLVHDATTERGQLEVVDAATLETVATVQLPVRVPYGFHGNWLPTPTF